MAVKEECKTIKEIVRYLKDKGGSQRLIKHNW